LKSKHNPSLQFWYIFNQDVKNEWEHKRITSVQILFSLITVALISIGFDAEILVGDPVIFSLLFWLMTVLLTTQLSGLLFEKEQGESRLLFFQLYDPTHLIFAKILFGTLILTFQTSALTIIFLVFGIEILDFPAWMLTLLAGSASLAITASISSGLLLKVKGGTLISTLIALPLLLPQSIYLHHLGKAAVDGLSWSVSIQEWIIIGAIDGVLLLATLLLFPLSYDN
jgi:ABC-type transport system involved in cytochrome c biogenesis permease component